MYKRSVQPDNFDKRIKIVSLIVVVAFLVILLLGANIFLSEMKKISQGQEMILLSLTANEKPKITAEIESTDSDYVSKKEFIRYRNESKKAIQQLAKDLRRIQYKLKLKQTQLNRF